MEEPEEERHLREGPHSRLPAGAGAAAAGARARGASRARTNPVAERLRDPEGSDLRGPPLEIHPLTADRWDDFARLFGARGACGGCWCMHWRLARRVYKRNKGARNRAAMHARVVKGSTPPGVLAYAGDEPVGWCAVAPREEYPRLERARVLRRIDAAPVWSIVCLFVSAGHRRRGVSVALIEGAARFAAAQGATVVEGYPVEPKSGEMPPVFAWTGTAAAFLAAGFREAARGSPGRPIMRRRVARRAGPGEGGGGREG